MDGGSHTNNKESGNSNFKALMWLYPRNQMADDQTMHVNNNCQNTALGFRKILAIPRGALCI